MEEDSPGSFFCLVEVDFGEEIAITRSIYFVFPILWASCLPWVEEGDSQR